MLMFSSGTKENCELWWIKYRFEHLTLELQTATLISKETVNFHDQINLSIVL